MIKYENIVSNILKEAAIVKVPDFESGGEAAKWIKRQRPKSKIKGDIFNPETGEIFLEDGQKLTKYQIYRLTNLLSGRGSGRFNKKDSKTDDRDGGFLSAKDYKKYYRIVDRKNGVFVIYRSDGKKFYPYDEENIEDIIWKIIEEENEQYKYDGEAKGFKEGTKYYKVEPKGINQKYVLNNFEDYYDIKYKKLETWMEDPIFDDLKGVEYSEDSLIPYTITKKDKSEITKEDHKIITDWSEKWNKKIGAYEGVELFGGGTKEHKLVRFGPTFLN